MRPGLKREGGMEGVKDGGVQPEGRKTTRRRAGLRKWANGMKIVPDKGCVARRKEAAERRGRGGGSGGGRGGW